MTPACLTGCVLTVRRLLAVALLAVGGTEASRSLAMACPFCTALRPTLSQQRDEAAVVALGELTAIDADNASQGRGAGPGAAAKRQLAFRLHQVLKGPQRLNDPQSLTCGGVLQAKPGTLVVLMGNGADDVPAERLSWSFTVVNETSYAYFARAPGLRESTAERLKYFVEFLEHRDPLIADDAYLELGHAPYDKVATVADRLSSESLRKWVLDQDVPEQRKGLYGMLLGIAADPKQRQANSRFLRKLIEQPADDFRAGFDGLLGGYLMAAGETGLSLVEKRILANPEAADGDVRHALTALRFYYEYGEEISAQRLAQALELLLERPQMAAAAIVDLARWQAWTATRRVGGLFERPEYQSAATQRAIVGYLLACPTAEAAAELDRLRKLAPDRVAEAEKYLSAFPGNRAG